MVKTTLRNNEKFKEIIEIKDIRPEIWKTTIFGASFVPKSERKRNKYIELTFLLSLQHQLCKNKVEVRLIKVLANKLFKFIKSDFEDDGGGCHRNYTKSIYVGFNRCGKQQCISPTSYYNCQGYYSM